MFTRPLQRTGMRLAATSTRAEVQHKLLPSTGYILSAGKQWLSTTPKSSTLNGASDLPAPPVTDRHHRAALLPQHDINENLLRFRAYILRGQFEEAWKLYTMLQHTGFLSQLKAEDHSRLLRALCNTVGNTTMQSNLFVNGTIGGKKAEDEEDVGEVPSNIDEVQCARALQILNNFIVHQYRPDMRDFAAALLILGRRGNVADVERIWQTMVTNNSWQPSLFAWNARLDAHVRTRAVVMCYKIVREMHQQGVAPDSLTYDLLGDLQGLVGHPEGTTRLLRQRLETNGYKGFETLLVSELAVNSNDSERKTAANGTNSRSKFKSQSRSANRMAEPEFPLPPPTVHTFNRAIRAYKRAGDIEGATRIYRLLTESIQPPDGTLPILPNVSTFNEFIAAQYKAEFEVHLALLERMQQNSIAPDAYTYHLLIKYACWTRIHWNHAERLWKEMLQKDITPLGRTCKVILHKLKRPRFEPLRKEAYNLWLKSQNDNGSALKVSY
ncbi:hypothetical protein BDF19DRAFT_429119 [Syncephalis fuscata]|nr:hypothetical protein BDF19DRAFT_429119 [Syncephalis fuscata]